MQEDNLGYFAHHPLRTASTALIIGVGAGVLASKLQNKNKVSVEKPEVLQ